MNYLVILDPHTGELEKILSGIKTMLLKEFDPSQLGIQQVRPGDSLYFVRRNTKLSLRVKACVVRTIPVFHASDEDLSRTLKEMQPKLQLIEEQFSQWAIKTQALLVEFESAQKINLIQLAAEKINDHSDWIPFEDFSQII